MRQKDSIRRASALTYHTPNPTAGQFSGTIDALEVKEVLVVLRRLSGELIEQGAAVADQGTWKYVTQTQVPAGETVTAEAIAVDYPGHTSSKRLGHACGPRAQ
jgi:hypothetical protein